MNNQMNKKGSSVLMIIFELIIVIFVIYMTFIIAERYGSSDTANKVNLANDIKMMMDVLVATPGDVIVNYPGDVSRYTITMNSYMVSVLVKGEKTDLQVIRRYFLPIGYEAGGYSGEGDSEEASNICFYKINKDILMQPCQ